MGDVEWFEHVSLEWVSYWRLDKTDLAVRHHADGRITVESLDTYTTIAGPFDTLDAAKAAYLMITGEQSDG